MKQIDLIVCCTFITSSTFYSNITKKHYGFTSNPFLKSQSYRKQSTWTQLLALLIHTRH